VARRAATPARAPQGAPARGPSQKGRKSTGTGAARGTRGRPPRSKGEAADLPRFWKASERPKCPKCGKTPALITVGMPGPDWIPPEPPRVFCGCMPPLDGAGFECVACGHRWGDWRRGRK